MTIVRIAVMLLSLAVAVAASAKDFEDPILIKQRLDLDQEQLDAFNLMMRTLDRDVRRTAERAKKRNQQLPPTDIKRRLRGKINRIYKKLDATAHGFLHDDQWETFIAYRKSHYNDARRRGFLDNW